ncbi:MAG: hypothetical protein AB2L12_04490 [Smithellaceae bacterium]
MKEITKKMMMVAFALFIMAAVPAVAGADEQKPAEDKVTGGIDLSVLSAYIWRGQELTRGSAVVQPSATISYKGFTFNAWGNLDTKPYSATAANYASKYTETDYTISYSKKFGILQMTPGYIYYALGAPSSGAAAPLDAQEVFLTLGLDTILSPTLTAYKEIDHYHQWYFLLGVSHTFEINKMIGVKLAATASYLASTDENTYARYNSNSVATTDKYNNFHDGTLAVSIPVAVTKSLTVTPTASYVFPLCDDARYEMKGRGLQGAANPSDRDSSYLYGGVTLSFTF